MEKREILYEIVNLDASKSCQDTDVPTKIIKENGYIFADFIHATINTTINKNEFLIYLKLADVISVFKNGSNNSKHNYRPISILKNISKVYERVMFKQIGEFMENYFSKFQLGFRKGQITQQCLIALIEKWKSATDKGKSFGALLTDLSKAFDCLPLELLIAKLHAYGFTLAALRLVHSYLSNRKQRTKIDESYSSWEEILFGVPQGSILGPLLFNIFISDLLIMMDDTNIAKYADDSTPFVSGDTPLSVITSLENAAEKLFEWFANNHMKANHDKCHLLMSTLTPISIKIKDYIIKNSDNEKLLGVTVDANLNFNCHLENILKKASKNVHVLARITPYMSIPKRKLLMNSFFTSQFNYCPLAWMCHSRTMNNKINRLNERCLRIVHSDKTSSYEKLLKKDGSVTIHTRNLQTLATEILKCLQEFVTSNNSRPFPCLTK